MIQRSRSSGQFVFYPRVAAPVTGETDLEWVPASGDGTIYAITVNRTKTGSENLAIIELAEGVKLMSRIDGVETAPIGARVKAKIVEVSGGAAVVFDLVGEVAS